jgi:hypothetical protein
MLYLDTPIGKVEAPEFIAGPLSKMSDEEVCNKCFELRSIDPAALAELQRRKLVFRGDREVDVRERIARKGGGK